jgi:N-acetylneuraminate synthase
MSATATIRIGQREIGPGRPVYVIAELSANHHGRFEDAVRVVHAAKAAGADAVKLQTYTADTLTIRSDAPPFRHGAGSLWAGTTLHDLYTEAFTPWDWQPRLQAEARSAGIDLFSSPFDPTAVEFLERMDVPAYKIASFELVDLPLIQRAAATGKPLILSTGMATLDEIREAVAAARAAGPGGVALLKCTSAYPAPADEMNLRAIPALAAAFGAPAGLSDHTLGIAAAVAAVALGAVIVEKHLTLSRAAPGPDSAFSLEPDEFRGLVRAVRETEAALGEARFEPTPREAESLRFRRSLYVVRDVRRGERFTPENVRSIRPAGGLAPKHLDAVLGRRAARDAVAGTPLNWDLVER